jgi:hypothetical protein
MMESMLPLYDELARVVSLPPNEFNQQYPQFMEKARSTSPIANVLLPNMEKVFATERRTQARMAMLLAAAAVLEGGPSKLKGIKDPFGENPFEYRPLKEGFELKSNLRYKGQPVTIVIGEGTK